jgi:hypothetical protein
MDEFERASRVEREVLEKENNNLRRELQEVLKSRGEFESEVKILRDRLGALEMERSGQGKTSAEVSQVGGFGPDPGSPPGSSRILGHPVCIVAEESMSDDELLAEIEAYEMEQGVSVIKEEPEGQKVWWDDIREPLVEVPLEPEPVGIMRDLIQFEKDPALVLEDVLGDLDECVKMEYELSLLLEEFTAEKDWEKSSEGVLVPPSLELGEGNHHLSCAELWAPDEGEDLMEKPVGKDTLSLPPATSLMNGWELISDDLDTSRVILRLAYVRRFINSCWGKFRPMSRGLSTVETDLAGQHLEELRRQEGSLWGESSVGWTADLPQ